MNSPLAALAPSGHFPRSAMRSDDVPALVLGDGITLLGVLRCLARHGIGAWTRTDAAASLPTRSRWYRAVPTPPDAPDPTVALAEWLERLPLRRAVLLPCSDDWTRRVSALAPSDRFPHVVPSPQTIDTATDKAAFADALRAAEVPHPRTVRVDGQDTLARLGDDAFANAFLKPRDSQAFFRHFGVKAFRVTSRDDAMARLSTIPPDLRLVLQEYVPGPFDTHLFVDGFVDRGGTVRAMLARRRLRIYPPDFGNSTYVVTVDPGPVASALESLRRLFAHMGLTGIFSAEFKQDSRDGAWRLLEVNARPWWYVDFAARCGVDVCHMAWRDAQGMTVPTVERYAVGRRLVYPYYDYYALRATGSGPLPLRLLAAVMRSSQPVWTWSDPAPALRAVSAILAGRLRKVLR